MSSSKFVSNLNGMNEEENFSKDLLKVITVADYFFRNQSQIVVGESNLTFSSPSTLQSLYNSIKSEPLEWAV